MRKINWKFMLNNKGFFDIIVPLLIAGGIGAGAAELFSGLSSGSKTAAGPTPAALPDTKKQQVDAAKTVADQRAALLASGGVTDYTGGMGVLTGTDVGKAALIGG